MGVYGVGYINREKAPKSGIKTAKSVKDEKSGAKSGVEKRCKRRRRQPTLASRNQKRRPHARMADKSASFAFYRVSSFECGKRLSDSVR